ncbi:hypothetical protein NHH03_14905 [Stieleria sp. TO1_6]|uniref:hypothetical protein n=1 Tax=Stieleria tagensis TaxID=2956795 RepID=UPI00209B04C9|nr:hypothetical protein [Stieleria tagensis]MCO8123036.1 hypothetical protein [Stieleria tagensis]
MSNVRNGDAVIAESFLDVRAKLLEVAATFDRIDRCCGDQSLGDDARMKQQQLTEATEILLSGGADRAERLQRLFSREYESDWRTQFGLMAD